MTDDWDSSDEGPIRERAPLGHQSFGFEASKSDRKDVLAEKRDNLNRMHKPRLWEHKTKKTEVGTSETELSYHQDDTAPNRW